MPQTINNAIDKKRIAKNTLLLYVRMAFMLLVGFYTVRLLLNALGVSDYGLYNVIFGLVAIFSFFSGAMSSTVQRFLCHELGQSNLENTQKVFTVSVFLFLVLTGVIILLAETVGLWFVCSKMAIPAGRENAALIVYQFSIFLTIFKVLQIPYTAAITSYENMRTFAQISILDAVLHLAAVLALKFISADRLICFAALYTFANLVTLGCYVVYCLKKYPICRISWQIDRNYLKSMSAFFSWSLFGAVANISKQQGLNVLLNIFCGVVLNATWGIATQVGGAVNAFVSSFQQAFNPQILKSYSNPDKEAFLELLQSCSRYSFLLIWLVALPVLLQTEFLLKLWLGGTLPEGAVIFTRLMLIYVLFDAIVGPLWVAVSATGKIKRYQIEISCLVFSSFVFSFIALKLGAPAYSVAVINTAVNAAALLYRLIYLRREIRFRIRLFCLKALLPMAAVAAISTLCGIATQPFAGNRWYTIIGYLLAISLANAVIMLFTGLSRQERCKLKTYIKGKLTR